MEIDDSIGSFYRSVIAKENSEKYWIEDILTDPYYFDWLKYFTCEYTGFNDGKWIYYNKEISYFDKIQINKLHLLYKGINFWAEKNHIYPNLRGYDEFYMFKVDNIGYEIGVSTNHGLSYFCDRVEIKKGQEFIEFNDVLNDITISRAVIIDERLEVLSNVIVSLHELGVPLNVIKSKVEDIFDNSSSKQKIK